MTEVAFWFVHTVTVDTYLGVLAGGEQWDTADPVPCWVEEDTKMVRDANGNEVVSSARVFAPLDQRTAFSVDSKVTLPSGRVSRVLGVAVHDSGTLALGLDHVEVALV